MGNYSSRTTTEEQIEIGGETFVLRRHSDGSKVFSPPLPNVEYSVTCAHKATSTSLEGEMRL